MRICQLHCHSPEPCASCLIFFAGIVSSNLSLLFKPRTISSPSTSSPLDLFSWGLVLLERLSTSSPDFRFEDTRVIGSEKFNIADQTTMWVSEMIFHKCNIRHNVHCSHVGITNQCAEFAWKNQWAESQSSPVISETLVVFDPPFIQNHFFLKKTNHSKPK